MELPDPPALQPVLGDRFVFDLSDAPTGGRVLRTQSRPDDAAGATRDAAPGSAPRRPHRPDAVANACRTDDHGPAQSSFGAAFFENAVDFQIVEGVDAQTTRFPVLADWNFECDAGGDFESLMVNLDIGLLGPVPVAQGEQGASVDPGPQVAPMVTPC